MTELTHHVWRKSVIGKDLTEAEAIELHLLSRREHYKAGQHIFEEGKEAHELFLIVEGEVEVVKRAPDGDRVTVLATLGPGSVVGEMSMLCQEARSATGRVKSDTLLLRVEWRHFQELLANHPTAAYKLIYSIARMLAGRLKRINLKVAELTATAQPAVVEDKRLEEFASFKQKLLSDWSF